MADVKIELKEYASYRSYLQAYAQSKRTQSKAWSFGQWARRLGLRGTASLTMVLNGQRHPGPKMTQKFIRYFGFDRDEKKFFKSLIRFEKEADPQVRLALAREISSARLRSSRRILNVEEYRVLSDVHSLTLRELPRLKAYRPNVPWIRQRLMDKKSAPQIEQSLRVLQDLDLMDTRAGATSIKTKNFETLQDIPSEAIRNFHENALELGKGRLRSVDVEEREYGSVTLAVKRDDLQRAKELIRKFQDDFEDLIQAESGADEVYQLNIQFFPMTNERNLS